MNLVYKILIFLLIFIAFVPSIYADKWFSKDKLFHFTTSCIIVITVSGPLDYYVSDRTKVLGSAAIIAFSFGILKEIKDMKKGSREDFSYRDLTYDGLGILSGVILANGGMLCGY